MLSVDGDTGVAIVSAIRRKNSSTPSAISVS